jgi:hypothetical protein
MRQKQKNKREWLYGELRSTKDLFVRSRDQLSNKTVAIGSTMPYRLRLFGLPLTDAVTVTARSVDHAAERLADAIMQKSTCPDCPIRILTMDNKTSWTFEQGKMIKKVDRNYTGGRYVDV